MLMFRWQIPQHPFRGLVESIGFAANRRLTQCRASSLNVTLDWSNCRYKLLIIVLVKYM